MSFAPNVSKPCLLKCNCVTINKPDRGKAMHGRALNAKLPRLVALIGAAFLMITGNLARSEIPSPTGVINACYDKTNGNLRVIDPSLGQACRTNEIVITWSQGGTGALAFAHINFDGAVTLSDNLSAADITHNAGGPYCFYNIPAKNVMVTPDATGGIGQTGFSRFAAQIGDPNSNCNPGATAVVYFAQGNSLMEFPFFVLFH